MSSLGYGSMDDMVLFSCSLARFSSSCMIVCSVMRKCFA
jgi:hypothetical protein